MLPGGFSPTPLQKSWSESQLGWWHSPIWKKNKSCSKPPISFISMRNETLNWFMYHKKVGKHVAFGTKTFGTNRNHGVKQGRWCQLNSRLRDPMTISLTHRTSIQFNHQPLCFWKPRISWMASTYQHGNLTYCIWTSNIWIEVKLIGGSMLRFNAESRNKRGVGFHNYIIGQHPNF